MSATRTLSLVVLLLALAAAAPHASSQLSGPDAQELALKQEALTQQILNDVAEYLDPASRAKSLSPAAADIRDRAWQKRTITPFSGSQDQLQTIKRQIRYHQCYFNPISCFSRK